MPKILEKHNVLNGRGSVVLYGSGSSAGRWFYREWHKDEKKYLLRQIPDAASAEEAVAGCLDIAFELKQDGVQTKTVRRKRPSHSPSDKPQRESIDTAIGNYLAQELDRADAGLITHETYRNRANIFLTKVKPYLESIGCYYTDAIKIDTFDTYLVFRADTTPLQRQQEVKHIKHWCTSYLAKRGLINPILMFSKDFLPKQRVTESDRLKNPAINAEDWKTIIDYVRDEWRHQVKDNFNQRYWYWRNLFWHFLLFSKNTGMSPEEVIKMKWKQIELVDEGRLNSKGEREVWELAYISTIRSKTKAAREIPCNQARELRRWKEFVVEYCTNHKLPLPTLETEVFGNPFPRSGSKDGWRPYCRTSFSGTWRQVRSDLDGKLRGHRYSPHPYSQYSMRSTFIEEHLLKGTPVVEVARMAGHSITETQRSYERLDLRRKGMEIAAPEFGKSRAKRGKSTKLF